MDFQFSNEHLLQAVKQTAELNYKVDLNTCRSVGEYLKRTAAWYIKAQMENAKDEHLQQRLKVASFILAWVTEQMEADQGWLDKLEDEYTILMAGSDRAPVESIKSVDEWYLVTNTLSRLSAQIVAFEKANTDGSLDKALAMHKREWVEMVCRSAKGPKPYRDQVIRNKAYAFSIAASMGKSINDKECEKAFLEDIFAEEVAFLVSVLTEDEVKEQHQQAYNMDLSQYIEVLALYYCNKLLNLADGGDRELYQRGGKVYQRLLELTAKLEEQKMFDEFYVARSAVVHTFGTLTNVWLRPSEEYTAWATQASDMLTEFYMDPLITKF